MTDQNLKTGAVTQDVAGEMQDDSAGQNVAMVEEHQSTIQEATECTMAKAESAMDKARVIPTSVHAVLDYVSGATLIAAPWIFDLKKNSAEGLVPMAVGASMIGLSMVTDYEGGVVRRVPMKTHLAIDGALGAAFAASPWALNYSKRSWVPHFAAGMMEVAASLLTQKTPKA